MAVTYAGMTLDETLPSTSSRRRPTRHVCMRGTERQNNDPPDEHRQLRSAGPSGTFVMVVSRTSGASSLKACS
jgi:hypothetical protein